MYRSARNSNMGQHIGWSPVILLVFVVALIAVSGCQKVAPVVKIGLVAPFEGRSRDVGYDVLYSARLAVREINAAGGIDGTRVALVALDDGGSPELAQAAANSLLIDPAVVAVVGHWLPETSETAAPIYANGSMTFLRGGEGRFSASEPDNLTTEFIKAYERITPFDETPGVYAGPAYDAFQQIFISLADAQRIEERIDRRSVQEVFSMME